MYNWPAGFFSPASCWSMPTAEQFAAMSAAAAAHSTVSCSSGNMGMFNVVKKYKRAKALLQVRTVTASTGIDTMLPMFRLSLCFMNSTLNHLPAMRDTRHTTLLLLLLQTQLQETQRLKQVVDMECQKAAAAAMHAKALEAQLTASTAALQDAQRAQFELQQQVRTINCTSSRMPRQWRC
jgi:hypothetical protein